MMINSVTKIKRNNLISKYLYLYIHSYNDRAKISRQNGQKALNLPTTFHQYTQ